MSRSAGEHPFTPYSRCQRHAQVHDLQSTAENLLFDCPLALLVEMALPPAGLQCASHCTKPS
jgi:hypothetical protein